MLELILNYTLAFIMWLVIARAIMSLFTTDMNNFIYAMLYKSTEPLYRVARNVFPKGTTFFYFNYNNHFKNHHYKTIIVTLYGKFFQSGLSI